MRLLSRQPTNKRELHQGKGIGVNCLKLCVGSRVRCTQNLCTMIGLYQGALGTVVGFGFKDSDDPSSFAFDKAQACKDRAAGPAV